MILADSVFEVVQQLGEYLKDVMMGDYSSASMSFLFQAHGLQLYYVSSSAYVFVGEYGRSISTLEDLDNFLGSCYPPPTMVKHTSPVEIELVVHDHANGNSIELKCIDAIREVDERLAKSIEGLVRSIHITHHIVQMADFDFKGLSIV